MKVPSGVSRPGVLRLSDFQCAGVVAGDPLNRLERAFAGHLDFPHVADVEQAGTGAHREMLVGDPGVFDRHIPSRVRHHACARCAMPCMQWGCAEAGAAVSVMKQDGRGGSQLLRLYPAPNERVKESECLLDRGPQRHRPAAEAVEHTRQMLGGHGTDRHDLVRPQDGRHGAAAERRTRHRARPGRAADAMTRPQPHLDLVLVSSIVESHRPASGIETLPRLVEEDEAQRMTAEHGAQAQKLSSSARKRSKSAALPRHVITCAETSPLARLERLPGNVASPAK